MASGDASSSSFVPSAGVLARRVLGLVAVAVVLALAVSVFPGLGDVRGRLLQADPAWIVVVVACALASTVSYVVAVRGTLERRIPWGGSWTIGMAEQGSNVLVSTGGVGGPALGALVLHRAGVPTAFAAPRSAALFLLTSATSFAAIVLAGTLTGLGILPGGTSWVGTLLPAALAIGVVGAVAALGHLPVSETIEGQGRVGRWTHRLAALLRDGVQESLVLLRARDPLVIGGCIGYLAFDVASLGAAYQAFGGEGALPIGTFVLAYTLGQAGGLLPTPGGIGGTEGGLIGLFVLYGAPVSPTTAAVLAYRVFQLGLPVIFGVIAFARIRSRLADDEFTAAVAARFQRP